MTVTYKRRRGFNGPQGTSVCHHATYEAGGHRFSASEYVCGREVFDVDDFKRRAVERIARMMRDAGVAE